MSDPENTPTTNDDSRSEEDRRLDALLHTASWPDAPADAVHRLQSRWNDLERVQVADVPSMSRAGKTDLPAATRRRVGSLAAMVAVAAIAAAAFWIGRTTAPEPGDRVVESENTSDTDVPNDVSPSPKPNDEPRSQGPSPSPQNIAVNEETGPEMVPPDGNSPDTPPPVILDSPLEPETDPIRRTQRGVALAQKQRDKEQLDAVLTCLIDRPNADSTCCRPLMRRRAAFEYLLWEVVQNATGQRQVAAVTAIGFVGTRQSIPKLVQTAENDELRPVAVQALKRRADERLLASIAGQDDDPDIAREFAIELVQRDTNAAAKAFLELVKDPRTRNRCLEIVDEASRPMVDAWFSAFDSSLVSDRIAAALTLGRRTDIRTHERIRQLVSAYPTRWEPVAALMASGSEEAMQALTALQQQPGRYAVIHTAAIQLKSLPGSDAAASKKR